MYERVNGIHITLAPHTEAAPFSRPLWKLKNVNKSSRET